MTKLPVKILPDDFSRELWVANQDFIYARNGHFIAKGRIIDGIDRGPGISVSDYEVLTPEDW